MTFFIFILLFCLIIVSFFVISSKNPIHSVLSLILAFLFAALLLFCLEAEFLAFMFLIIYIGAIAIFFLFIVMMFDLKTRNSIFDIDYFGVLDYFLIYMFFNEIIFFLFRWLENESVVASKTFDEIDWFSAIDPSSNIEIIGQVLYTYYFIFFLMVGVILFIAAISAIFLTLTINQNKKKNFK